MAELPRGTVTLLFTDIEGSTRLLQEVGRDRYVRALEAHRRLLRDAFAVHDGVEVEMQGDSFHYAFARASDAVRAADAGQRALAEHDWKSEPIKVRIGIHTGEPVVSDGLYAGLDVHRAARVMSAGHGGQVIVSPTTHGLLDEEFDLTDLGVHRLKDLSAPQKLYQLGRDEFPPLKTLDGTNLPVAASPLVGREQELAELLALVRNGTRLLTITGPGGSGKTRLALQVAAEFVGSIEDGVRWVPLAPVHDPALVLPTIAQALSVRGDVFRYLRGKRLLILLDNLEHLRPSAPQLAALLAASPGIQLLATSRAPLHVAAEREYLLESLLPRDAVTLFVERARAAGRDVHADQTVEMICRRMDGLPLAIELAAARVKLLGPETVLKRLEHALPLLTAGPRDAPERQRTLGATIEWSYQLLPDHAKDLFVALSVFQGTFSLGAAEEICGAEIDSLAELVDLHLLKPLGESRFLMLQTVREYASTKLGDAMVTSLRRDHARWYGALAARADEELRGPDQASWFSLLADELPNLRVALRWCVEVQDNAELIRLSAGLGWFWYVRGPVSEGAVWLDRALASASDEHGAARLRLLRAAAALAATRQDVAAFERYAAERLELATELGNTWSQAAALGMLGVAAGWRRDYARARDLHEQSIALHREAGHTVGVATSLATLGYLHFRELIERGDRDFSLVKRLQKEAVELFRTLGDEAGESLALHNLAETYREEGRLADAAGFISESTRLAQRVGSPELLALSLELVARIASAVGEYDQAVSLIAVAESVREIAGIRRQPEGALQVERELAELAVALGESGFTQATERGRAMTVEDACGRALELTAATAARATVG